MKKDILKDLLAKPGRQYSVSDFDPSFIGELSKQDAKGQLTKNVEKLSELQSMLYAQDRYSILIIFQAMDAAGKDGTIKHVMSGINPKDAKYFRSSNLLPRNWTTIISGVSIVACPKEGESEFSTVLTMKTCLSPKCIPKLYCPTNCRV